MEGGLFGLSLTQKAYLYASQLIPALIVWLNSDLMLVFCLLQAFYLISSFIYIRYLSIQKELYPYIFYETNKLNIQKQKGLSLAISAYLLITVYGLLFFKIGKVVLPDTLPLGQDLTNHWAIFITLLLINPLLEEWFWRLYQPKTLQQDYEKNWMINITYLIFHFALFSRYLGFWRSLPLVTSFFSVGRSMSHIKTKYGIVSAIITHYGITLAGITLYLYVKHFTKIKFI